MGTGPWPGWPRSPLPSLFQGPPSNAMWALGDKVASTIVAQTVQIPTLPWSGSGKRLLPALSTLPVPPFLSSFPKAKHRGQVTSPAVVAAGIGDPTGWFGQGVFGDGVHRNRGNGMCHHGVPRSLGTADMPPQSCHPGCTIALAVPTGLVAQWSEEDQKHQQTISIPLEMYAQGCVKDVEEGLEVQLSPVAAGCLLSTVMSPPSPRALALLASQHT